MIPGWRVVRSGYYWLYLACLCGEVATMKLIPAVTTAKLWCALRAYFGPERSA